ncbi:MAG TPA: hypothetical protein VMW79_06155 [Anaerolineae bacterium]|nr:hypothetical protein [Anaerolineae bacterium]HUW95983.1 hypothetical protein [Anaerolineae bacterium]
MGYKLAPRTALLVFEDEYKGAEVRAMLDHPLGMFIEAQKLQESQDIEGLCRFVAGILVDWNIEDEQGPLPATYEGILRAYPALINTLITEWMKAQVTPTAPLPEE